MADFRAEIDRQGDAADWDSLVRELDSWSAAGRVATLWLRDDDAVAWTPQLDRLFEAAGDVPIALAVIPASAERSLVERVKSLSQVGVLQHGWRHINHLAPYGPSEYPAQRRDEEVAAEFRAGRKRLSDMLGNQALPVFAPPYHGFDDRFLPLLAQSGLRSLSRKGPRSARQTAGIFQTNVHVVLINWTEPPSFGDPGLMLQNIVAHLRARRLQQVDGEEPTGVLTHHLVQDEDSYAFLRQLIDLTAAHPAACWLQAREVFAEALS